ncbi:unnamed protein product, partial [Rotaria sp. Silwood2]
MAVSLDRSKWKKRVEPEITIGTTSTIPLDLIYFFLSATPLRGTNIAFSPQARWSPKAITVAGDHGRGSDLNQLNASYGL